MKDFESVEAISRFLRAVYRGMGDPGTGSLQVTSDLVGNIGNQAKPKLWSDAVWNPIRRGTALLREGC